VHGADTESPQNDPPPANGDHPVMCLIGLFGSGHVEQHRAIADLAAADQR